MSDNILIEQKFLKAYDEYSDAIFRHCYFRVSDREKAKDLTQDTFTKTWEYVLKNGEVTDLRAFLYKVANNLIIDTYRKKKEDSLDDMMENSSFDIGEDETEQLFNSITVNQIQGLFAKLDDIYKDAIVMRYIDDASPKEIARALNVSENVVSVRIYRGLKKLRELLKHDE
ncbi:MAG: hypothetical protein A3G02_02365 [Candidatus Yanofskybacteria bacterium RIFCSPLOWO2_12_FULL_44_13b]|uniref:RNA polymerase sigma factor n=2 Tax=Candidatus Yanofskyibacteriota TaxID=1752733 RepID=A0A1F8H1J8_9BACT|nr:MAG: RNA polymerase, sigma-24 subunit, ECF subfamily [Candidatus Yanofskybacteria bacterium GW2011_GWA2_44_10]KKT89966.1 MAG: RNA polymerase, sigma-24 subunit, ECF subfamily [Candidatus Yanofskybacteria bacterium GW2011_GWB1_45_11]OGN02077.1 MAG: hypothetical protein A2657_01920 [Candidatus Yanofskybacteria bacterium RIFCSPHIGHO2_01_FULL_44_110b]OGN18514.1 MAG: hypothetical protein A3F50_02085 [Candidatus Yanofskybacteria bacterium RIFCSPHIGHO2_12_FULL_44_29b]OGN26466.1 MAG: hypothetical pro